MFLRQSRTHLWKVTPEPHAQIRLKQIHLTLQVC